MALLRITRGNNGPLIRKRHANAMAAPVGRFDDSFKTPKRTRWLCNLNFAARGRAAKARVTSVDNGKNSAASIIPTSLPEPPGLAFGGSQLSERLRGASRNSPSRQNGSPRKFQCKNLLSVCIFRTKKIKRMTHALECLFWNVPALCYAKNGE